MRCATNLPSPPQPSSPNSRRGGSLNRFLLPSPNLGRRVWDEGNAKLIGTLGKSHIALSLFFNLLFSLLLKILLMRFVGYPVGRGRLNLRHDRLVVFAGLV